MKPRAVRLAALALALVGGCRAAPDADRPEAPWSVRIVIDGAATDVRVARDATALAATRAAARVEQAWVCCSDEDVWAIDGVASDAARDGYWSWWLDGELGPGFAHQVRVHDGATVEWRYGVADPEGRGAEPVARIAALSAAACAAIEAFGGGRNLVAHGDDCRLAAHAALPRLSADASVATWNALTPDCGVDAPHAPAGLRALRFAPGLELADWEALGAACGRLGAARVAWTASRRAR